MRLNNAELQTQTRQRGQEISKTRVATIGPCLRSINEATVYDILLVQHRQSQLTGMTLLNPAEKVIQQIGSAPQGAISSWPCRCKRLPSNFAQPAWRRTV